MSFTGIYYFPLPPQSSNDTSILHLILDRLKTCYSLNSLPGWTLQHRLFRKTSWPNPSDATPLSNPEDSQSSGPRYMQVLSLSHLPERRSYLVITTNPPSSQTRAGTPATPSSSSAAGGGGGGASGSITESSPTTSDQPPATVAAIPSGPCTEDFIQLMISRFGPLWTLRQTVQVHNGLAFSTGPFEIRVGEVRQGHTGGTQIGKGVIVEIKWTGEEINTWKVGEMVIRAFWKRLEVKGANLRECIKVDGVEGEEREGFACVRQWCDALRPR